MDYRWALAAALTTVACSGAPEPLPPSEPPVDAGAPPPADAGTKPLAPHISIVEPFDGALLSDARVLVRGEAVDLAEVWVQDVPVAVEAGRFEVTVDLAEEGAHLVVVRGEGAVDETRQVLVDLSEPKIEILEPARGAFIEADGRGLVRVTGRVTDRVTAVEELVINGVRIPVTGETFSEEIGVEEGVNLIEVVAVDQVGRRADALQSLIYGTFQPWDQPMPEALSVALGEEVFVMFETQFEQGLLAGLSTSTPGGGGQGMTITAIDVGDVDVQMTPRTGFFDLLFAMDAVRIDFDLDTVVLGVPIQGPGIITIERFEVATEAHLRVDAAGELVGQFEDSEATITNFTLAIAGVAPFITQTLANILRPQIEAGLVTQIEQTDLVQLFDFTQFLPEGTNAEITGLFIDPAGLTMVASAGIELPQDPATPIAPGVLMTPGTAPAGPPTDAMLRMSLSDDLTNNLLFNTWRSGALTSTIGQPPPGSGVGLAFDAATFALFFGDELYDLAPADTLVGLELVPLLPPVTSFDGEAAAPLVRAIIGDILLHLRLEPEGEAPIVFATFAVHMTMENTVETVGGEIRSSSSVQLRIDLADAPRFPISEEVEGLVEGLFGGLLGGGLGLGGGEVGGLPIPIDPAGLQNVSVEIASDYLTISGDL